MSCLLDASYQHGAGVKLLRTVDDIDSFLTELVVGVDQATGLGAVRFAGDEGEWFSRGEQVNPDGVRYLYYGTAHEFPADAEVPLSLVRKALRELLAREGMRPECVLWQAPAD